MRPIATHQNPLRFPLNELLSTPANVRLLRLLADGVPEPIGVVDAAKRCGLSAAGARRALTKMAKTGFVERIGSGHAQQFALRDSDPLTDGIRALFKCERERHQALIVGLRNALIPLTEIQAAWIDLIASAANATLHIGILSDTRSLAHLGEQVRQRINEIEREFDVTIEVRMLSRADLPDFALDEIQMLLGFLDNNESGVAGTHAEKDQRALEFSLAIARLLNSDPTLIVRAVRHLDLVLNDEPGNAAHDLREWRNILSHYSKQRLRDFLASNTQRAERLRQSSPFFAVLTPQQREQVYAAAESSHDS